MIQLNDAGIDATASAKLLEYQNLVNGKATYAERVEEAKSKFKSYNRKGNATFDEVKNSLMSCVADQNVAIIVKIVRLMR